MTPLSGLASGGFLGALVWRPAVGAWILTALLLAAGLAVRRVWRLLRPRLGAVRAAALAALRCAVLAALVTVLLDPACERRVRRRDRSALIVVVDNSASMQVRDRTPDAGSRRERALALAAQIERAAPADLVLRRYGTAPGLTPVAEWGALPQPPPDGDAAPAADRGGGLSALLLRLAGMPEVRNAAAVVLLTDGGDGPIDPARMPDAPLLVLGIGGDPEHWRDVAMETVRHPDRVETGARFVIEAALRGRSGGDPAFAARLRTLHATLERRDADAFTVVDEQPVQWSGPDGGTATVRFETALDQPGQTLWRVRAEPLADEVSPLNNLREFPITAARESLRVLYFSRRLGADFKFIRQELASDPAIAFHALVQTAGDRFLAQGDLLQAPEAAAPAGLPDLPALKRFNGLLLGSFPAAEWTAPEMEALRAYVKQGGGLLWIGGEDSFDAGYLASPLAALIPWRPDGAAGFLRETATVAAAAAGGARWAALFDIPSPDGAPPALQALHRPGPLKAGAVALLEARTAQGNAMPFLVEQPYGRGRVVTLTSNTTWRWALAGPPLDRLHRRLWRQAVRAAAGQAEEKGSLRVRLEQETPIPGTPLALTVEVLDATPQSGVAARLEGPEGVEVVGLEREPSVSGRWRGTLVCRTGGAHRLVVQALRNGQVVETFERDLAAAPEEREGARLEVDHAALQRLAARGGGLHVAEDGDAGLEWLAARWAPDTRAETRPLVSNGPWFLLALVALMTLEWVLRRKSNLV